MSADAAHSSVTDAALRARVEIERALKTLEERGEHASVSIIVRAGKIERINVDRIVFFADEK